MINSQMFVFEDFRRWGFVFKFKFYIKFVCRRWGPDHKLVNLGWFGQLFLNWRPGDFSSQGTREQIVLIKANVVQWPDEARAEVATPMPCDAAFESVIQLFAPVHSH